MTMALHYRYVFACCSRVVDSFEALHQDSCLSRGIAVAHCSSDGVDVAFRDVSEQFDDLRNAHDNVVASRAAMTLPSVSL